MHKKLKEVGGRTLWDERLADRITKEREEWRTDTWFGRHKEAMREVGEILKGLKTSGQKEFVINNFGPGRVKWSGYTTFETFELISQAERAGIKPEELRVYVYDRVLPPLIAVEGTKKIELSSVELARLGDSRYINEFFHGRQTESEDGTIVVEIEKKWVDRIRSFHADLGEIVALEKADVSFACLQIERCGLEVKNLVESTKEGGYILCNPISERERRVLRLRSVFERADHAVYKRD